MSFIDHQFFLSQTVINSTRETIWDQDLQKLEKIFNENLSEFEPYRNLREIWYEETEWCLWGRRYESKHFVSCKKKREQLLVSYDIHPLFRLTVGQALENLDHTLKERHFPEYELHRSPCKNELKRFLLDAANLSLGQRLCV